MDQVGAPGGLFWGELRLDLLHAGFDHIGCETGAAIETDTACANGFDHHAGGGNAAGHFANYVVKSTAVGVREQTVAEPFRIDGGQVDGVRRGGSGRVTIQNIESHTGRAPQNHLFPRERDGPFQIL